MNTGALGHMVDEQRLSSNLVSRERKLWEGGWLVSVGGKEKRTRVIILNLEFIFFVNKVAHLFFFYLLAGTCLIFVPPGSVLFLEGKEMRE